MKNPANYSIRFSGGIGALLICLVGASCTQLSGSGDQESNRLRGNGRNTPIVYVALGDSTGLGLGARNGGGYVDRIFSRIQTTHPGSRLLNLSTAWATTSDVLKKQVDCVQETQGTLVTISIGLNDLLQGTNEYEFARNYESIVFQLEKPGISIVITNLPDVTIASTSVSPGDVSVSHRLDAFNKRIDIIARRFKLPLVDLYKASQEGRGHPELISEDGIHPSDAGYELWANIMWPSIRHAIEE